MFYITYEELTHLPINVIYPMLNKFYITYEELTLCSLNLSGLTNFSFTLPMRNWHSNSSLFSGCFSSKFYITYEELTPSNVGQCHSLLYPFALHVLHYLWGIDTFCICNNNSTSIILWVLHYLWGIDTIELLPIIASL